MMKEQVKDTILSIAGGLNGITLKINGTSGAWDDLDEWNDEYISYGSRVFAGICNTAGTGTTTAGATLTVDGTTPITTSVKVTCTVKTQTQGEETFTLFTTKVKAAKKI